MEAKEKELIDYKIKTKKEARDKEIAEWGCALYFALFLIFIIYFLFKVVF